MPNADLMQIINLFLNIHQREGGGGPIRSLRGSMDNARQGFVNVTPPFGIADGSGSPWQGEIQKNYWPSSHTESEIVKLISVLAEALARPHRPRRRNDDCQGAKPPKSRTRSGHFILCLGMQDVCTDGHILADTLWPNEARETDTLNIFYFGTAQSLTRLPFGHSAASAVSQSLLRSSH